MQAFLKPDEHDRGMQDLYCEILYCRAESKSQNLPLTEYFLDMALQEIERLMREGAAEEPAIESKSEPDRRPHLISVK